MFAKSVDRELRNATFEGEKMPTSIKIPDYGYDWRTVGGINLTTLTETDWRPSRSSLLSLSLPENTIHFTQTAVQTRTASLYGWGEEAVALRSMVNLRLGCVRCRQIVADGRTSLVLYNSRIPQITQPNPEIFSSPVYKVVLKQS